MIRRRWRRALEQIPVARISVHRAPFLCSQADWTRGYFNAFFTMGTSAYRLENKHQIFPHVEFFWLEGLIEFSAKKVSMSLMAVAVRRRTVFTMVCWSGRVSLGSCHIEWPTLLNSLHKRASSNQCALRVTVYYIAFPGAFAQKSIFTWFTDPRITIVSIKDRSWRNQIATEKIGVDSTHLAPDYRIFVKWPAQFGSSAQSTVVERDSIRSPIRDKRVYWVLSLETSAIAF